MDDYIKRSGAVHALCKAVHKDNVDGMIPCENQTASCLWVGTRVCDYAREIDDLPSADAVEVVRCKDCKYCDTGIDEDGNHFLKCLGWAYGGTKEDDYCSHGVRKDG